jgi:hypothetical protein
MKPALGIACAALALAVGCAGPSTFVSPDPPPQTHVDARFPNAVDPVRMAIRDGMAKAGMSIIGEECSRFVLVADRRQLPYIGEDAGEPASGPLPILRMRAVVSPKDTDSHVTHVRVTVEPVCRACDGATPYEWEYPVELIRDVLEHARKRLKHRGPRIAYPPRYLPPPRRR